MTGLGTWPRPAVHGHRGLGETGGPGRSTPAGPDQPVENTAASFAAAIAAGADAVEFDVRLAADGTPVILHDESLERTRPGHTGAVAELTAAELAAAGVPTLAEVLTLVATLTTWDGGPARANAELKAKGPAAASALAAALTAAGLGPDRALVSSFDLATLVAVKEADPDRPCAALVPGTLGRQVIEAAAERGLDAVHPKGDDALTDRHIADAHDHDLLVYAWTVNDPLDQERLLDDGVDGLITDDPAALHTLLARSAARG